MVRIGQLYLDAGLWDGQQVVSADWVEQATTAQVGANDVAYGYLWWITDAARETGYMAHGVGRQVIHVAPTHDLVIVIATEFDERDPARMSTTLSRDAAERPTELAVIPDLTSTARRRAGRAGWTLRNRSSRRRAGPVEPRWS